MPSIETPPAQQLEDANLDEVAGRYIVLDDLHAEFQGASLGYPFFAIMLLLLSLATGYYRWSENNTAIQLQVTLIPFTALMAVSVHSWFWLLRIRRRLNAVRRRLSILGADEPIAGPAPEGVAKPS